MEIICSCCGIKKNESEFKKYITKTGKESIRKQCIECIKRKDRERYVKRKEQMIDYRKNHKDYFKEYHKNYYIKYKDKNHELLKEKSKNYYYNHKEERKQYEKTKRKNDKLYRLKCNIRNVINGSFRRIGIKKKKKTEEILECSIEKFIKYLYKTFENNYGYKYDGIEPVHIDHIKPLKYAKNEDEVIKYCHYTNLQLLKAEDNLMKNSKINYKIKGE